MAENSVTLSIIIPARNEEYLQATIDDLLKNMQTNIEIIVGLDEYWPNPPLKDDPRVIVYHSAERIGMRPMINKLAAIARGKYLMKTDAHCAFDEGYDQKLIEICNQGCTVLGIRYELDAEKWERKERTNCDFRYLSHPDADPLGGLRGLAWHEYKKRTKGQEVAETMSISGSGWLMEKAQFDRWGGLDENHGTFGQEGCEISCKTWLSGGRVLVNRRTWYAHWNRGKAPYALSRKQRDKSVEYSIDYWMGNKWPQQKYNFMWLIDHFSPVPGWENIKSEKPVKGPRQGTIQKGVKDRDVATLWESRGAISEPLKKHRLSILFDSLGTVLDEVIAGKTYTVEDMEKTRYWEYLRSHLVKRDRTPLTSRGRKRIIKKFNDSIRLFHSIKNDGLKCPLEAYNQDGNLILYKGYRRLVILHKLNYGIVPILIHKNIDTAKRLPARFDKRLCKPGSIVELGAKQFQKHGWRATDKYWSNVYLPIYDTLFGSLRRKKNTKILEFGVLRGASLALWKQAFPRATVYGVDKSNKKWQEFTKGVKGIKVLVGRQEDQAFLKKEVIPKGPFNIVVDDCDHNPDMQWDLFQTMWPSVVNLGYYIMEDCWRSYMEPHPNTVEKLFPLVERIYSDQTVMSVQFHYNLCIIRKGMREKGVRP